MGRTRRDRPVGIDARMLAYRTGGIAEHVRRLAAGLAEIAAPGDLVLLEHRRATRGAGPRSLRRARLFTPPHHRLEGLMLPAELARLRLGLLHATDMVVPFWWRGRAVVTVHDVAFLDDPGLLTAEAARYYSGVRRSVVRARLVITVSQHTRARLLVHTRADPARIRVIPNSVPEQYAADGEPAADEAALRSVGLAGTAYILFVGTIEPRKNLITLLEAYDRLAPGEDGPVLALAGADGWLSAPVHERLARMGPAAPVRVLGPVPGDVLPALYRGAAALAHPALDEGFGLTVAEAMAAGTPVVAARAGSLPEVAGDAALLVPPRDVTAWAEALARVTGDADVAAELAERGRRQASRFTVRAQAEATLAVYREALA